MKSVSSTLKLDLAQYHEMQTFAQFGSDLDASTKKILNHGEKVTELLKQPQYQPMSLTDQVISLYAVKHGYMDDIPSSDVSAFEKSLYTDTSMRICRRSVKRLKTMVPSRMNP
jgi:F-type H+-transporting ATPase subunit alpha